MMTVALLMMLMLMFIGGMADLPQRGAVMPYEEAVEMLKKSIKKMYGKKAKGRLNFQNLDLDETLSPVEEGFGNPGAHFLTAQQPKLSSSFSSQSITTITITSLETLHTPIQLNFCLILVNTDPPSSTSIIYHWHQCRFQYKHQHHL